MTVRSVAAKSTPAAQLGSLIAKFDPEHQKLIRAVRSALRKRLPTANELVYDYGKSLVIGYSPTEHGIDGIVSTAARAGGVDLYLNNGRHLPDPKKLLKGSGRQVRFVHLESARQMAQPDIEALIAAAIKQNGVPLPSTGAGKLIVRTAAAKKRPRRKTGK